MITQNIESGVNLGYDIGLIYYCIDSHCSSMGMDDDEFWALEESIAKLKAFLDILPEGTQQEVMNSSQYWIAVNDLMSDWRESISPVGGWPTDLVARLPLTRNSFDIERVCTWL